MYIILCPLSFVNRGGKSYVEASSVMVMISLLIFCAAVFVNGATDAAGAVTGAVCSGALSIQKASLLAGAMNLCGMAAFSLFLPSVSRTVSGAADLSEGGGAAVCAVLGAVVLWSGAAWVFGLPTSESHGILAAMAGVSLALGKMPDFFSPQWLTIFYGMLFSVVGGAFCGGLANCVLIGRGGRKAVISGCAAMAFLHGAQDGQKFIALMVSAGLLQSGGRSAGIFVTAVLMFLGTICGGRKIVYRMGQEMVHADTATAIASDGGSALALFLLSLLGIPASTTHVKMSAMAGATAVSGGGIGRGVVGELLLAWLLTFPICFFLGYSLLYLFA